MHGCSDLPELYLYVGQGYYKAFCTRISNYFGDKVHFAFSSAFSLDPQAVDDRPSHEGDASPEYEDDKPLYQWYCPEIQGHGNDSDAQTKAHPKCNFELGMDLMYRDGSGSNLPSVYEGASPDGC